MATSGSIGDLFVITIENDASDQVKRQITTGRALTVELITATCSTTGGAHTLTFRSRTNSVAAEVDMFGGAINGEVNDVTIVAQSGASGSGTMTLVPSAAQQVTTSTGTLSFQPGGNNAAYTVRFFCSAQNPTNLPVV